MLEARYPDDSLYGALAKIFASDNLEASACRIKEVACVDCS